MSASDAMDQRHRTGHRKIFDPYLSLPKKRKDHNYIKRRGWAKAGLLVFFLPTAQRYTQRKRGAGSGFVETNDFCRGRLFRQRP
jgi:hypothetical protein